MFKGIRGINIAVKDFDAAVKKYTALLGRPAKILGEKDFAMPGLKGAAFDINGFILQLLAGEEGTAVAKFVASKGEGMFLISLASDDVEADTAKMKEAGAVFVMDKPMSGSFGTVNFIHPKSTHGVQFELYDPEAKK